MLGGTAEVSRTGCKLVLLPPYVYISSNISLIALIFIFEFCLVQWLISGQKICDAGVKFLSSAPTKRPSSSPTSPVSNNFNVTILGDIYNLRSIATTNIPTPSTKYYTQRTYSFTSGDYSYYFRVPIAGFTSVTGLPIGRWDTDFWQGEGSHKLGFYSPNSWTHVGGSFEVSYVNGDYCGATGANRRASARFICSSSVVGFNYVYVENPICVCKSLVFHAVSLLALDNMHIFSFYRSRGRIQLNLL